MPSSKSFRMAVKRYRNKHYAIIHVRRELRAELKSLADRLGLSVPELIRELFVRYGERLASELGPSTPTAPAPGSTKAIPRSLVVEVGGQRFVIPEREWRAFQEILEREREPNILLLIVRTPLRFRALAQALLSARALYYDEREGRWRVSPSVKVSKTEVLEVGKK
jgi:hypothetical protein